METSTYWIYEVIRNWNILIEFETFKLPINKVMSSFQTDLITVMHFLLVSLKTTERHSAHNFTSSSSVSLDSIVKSLLQLINTII